MGPASPAWTIKLIERVRAGKPLFIEGLDGFSNVTDVDNVIDHLDFVVRHQLVAMLTFYHLAERSGLPWSYWLVHISDALQIPLVSVKDCSKHSEGIRDDFSNALGSVIMSESLVKLWHARVTGSVMRSALPLLPKFLRRRFGRYGSEIILHKPSAIVHDQVTMILLRCPCQFQSVTAPNWHNPCSSSASWVRVKHWIKEAGFFE